MSKTTNLNEFQLKVVIQTLLTEKKYSVEQFSQERGITDQKKLDNEVINLRNYFRQIGLELKQFKNGKDKWDLVLYMPNQKPHISDEELAILVLIAGLLKTSPKLTDEEIRMILSEQFEEKYRKFLDLQYLSIINDNNQNIVKLDSFGKAVLSDLYEEDKNTKKSKLDDIMDEINKWKI